MAVQTHQSFAARVADIADAYQLLDPLLGTTIASTLFAVALLASGVTVVIAGLNIWLLIGTVREWLA